ncbi:MAG: DMT family transporter [Anaerolineaceae bacterium]|nr:MAG: DMT family transporter [Anaerolineaceae bacterium]
MKTERTKGIQAALVSAFLLGLAPVLGRQAILSGFSPLAVVALRTGFAAALLFLIVAIFKRPFLYIYPVGFAGCMLAGAINGFGSIFYYMALARLPASIGQLLYSLYPFFLALWMLLDRHPLNRMTVFRVSLATLAVMLLTGGTSASIDWVGVGMMLVGALFYALHLPINQRVLYEVPAPTVTLYTLLAMSAVVIPAFLIFDPQLPASNVSWWPVVGLAFVTFFARLALFLGVKHIGGMQTALLGLSELLVAVVFSHIWLGESLTFVQWLGAAGLAISLFLVRSDPTPPSSKGHTSGWLSWIRPPNIPPDIPWGPHD